MASDIKIECDEIITNFLYTVNQDLYDALFNKLDSIYKLNQEFSDFNNIDKIIEEQFQYYKDNYFSSLEELDDLLDSLAELYSCCDNTKTSNYVEKCIEQFEDLQDILENDYYRATEYTDFKLFVSSIFKEYVYGLPATFKYNCFTVDSNIYSLYFSLKHSTEDRYKKIMNMIDSGYFISKS